MALLKPPFVSLGEERCRCFHNSAGNRHLKTGLMSHFHSITSTWCRARMLAAFLLFLLPSTQVSGSSYLLWRIYSFNNVLSFVIPCRFPNMSKFVKARHIQYSLVHGRKKINILKIKWEEHSSESWSVTFLEKSQSLWQWVWKLTCLCTSNFLYFYQKVWYNPFGEGNKSRHCHCWQGRGGGSKYSIKAIKKKTCFLKGSRQRSGRGQRCHVDWHVSGCRRRCAEGTGECGIISMRFYYQAIEVCMQPVLICNSLRTARHWMVMSYGKVDFSTETHSSKWLCAAIQREI